MTFITESILAWVNQAWGIPGNALVSWMCCPGVSSTHEWAACCQLCWSLHQLCCALGQPDNVSCRHQWHGSGKCLKHEPFAAVRHHVKSPGVMSYMKKVKGTQSCGTGRARSRHLVGAELRMASGSLHGAIDPAKLRVSCHCDLTMIKSVSQGCVCCADVLHRLSVC